MQIHLIAIGTKMPSWVNEAYEDYAKRLPADFSLKLIEIPAEKRNKNADIPRILEREGEKMWAAIPKNSHVIALDMKGKSYSTENFAKRLEQLQQQTPIICFLIGGPEGFAPCYLEKTHEKQSLSSFTLPHPLVRIILAEQVYRAWSVLKNHPYHRA